MVDVWLLVILALVAFLFFIYSSLPNKYQKIPPSPWFRLPLIGHLHLLSNPPWHSFHRLSRSLGPIFSLCFGSRLVVVISSASAAEHCFSQNDVVLANRPLLIAGEIVGYNFSTVATSPYGPWWRSLRKICTAQIFSSARLSSLEHVWSDAISDLVQKIADGNSKSADPKAVVMMPLVKGMMFKILMRILAGERGEFEGLMEIIDDVMKHAERANPVDFVPLIYWLNFGGYQKKLRRIFAKVDGFLQRILDDRRSRCENGGREDILIDNLLKMQQSDPESYGDEMIKGLVLVILSAGTDTTAANIEWAMSLLLNHPSILSKAKSEIDLQVGQSRLVNQSDLPKLPDLKNIISETQRLYPSVPLLLPHYASQDCTVDGYTIPRDTIVFVNAWAIHRDPDLWDEPLRFRPERFEGGNISGYKFMPFGFGRRACPGAGLANNVVGLALATLIQCFEWDRCSEEEVDMTEGHGLILPKAEPLEAVCKDRPIISSVYR